ncbi:MAG: RNA-binding protein, partial [Myxococcota bacterium]
MRETAPVEVAGQPSAQAACAPFQSDIHRGGGQPRYEMKKLFVGGLSWDTTDDSLRESFERHGEVTEAKVITDRDTGRSRGFAFVTFSDNAAAAAAIAAMDGSVLDGRTVRVNEAEEKGRGGGGGGGGGRGGGGGG